MSVVHLMLARVTYNLAHQPDSSARETLGKVAYAPLSLTHRASKISTIERRLPGSAMNPGMTILLTLDARQNVTLCDNPCTVNLF
jgi:hypothetical protein